MINIFFAFIIISFVSLIIAQFIFLIKKIKEFPNEKLRIQLLIEEANERLTTDKDYLEALAELDEEFPGMDN